MQALILFSPGAIFFSFYHNFLAALLSMVLWLWWWWWLTGCLAQSKREKHTMFSIIHKKKASNYTKSLKYNGGFHFGVLSVSFFIFWFFFRFKLPFFLHFLSFSLSLSLTQKSFFFTSSFSTLQFFSSLFFTSMCCIAWWQRMTMVYTSYPPKERKKK